MIIQDPDKWIKRWRETHSPEDSELNPQKELHFKSIEEALKKGYVVS